MMKAVIATSLLALAGASTLVADGSVPEATGMVRDVGTLGIGGYLLIQIGTLKGRVDAWLASLDKHHAAEREHYADSIKNQQRIARRLAELTAVLRHAHGVPDAVVRDFTPVPKDPSEGSPGRRRGVDPR